MKFRDSVHLMSRSSQWFAPQLLPPSKSAGHRCLSPRWALTFLSPRGQETVSWPHPRSVKQLSLLAPLFFCYWERCGNFLEEAIKKAEWGGCHVLLSRVPAQPCKRAWARKYVPVPLLNFLAALHGRSCILCYRDNRAGPALGRERESFCVLMVFPQWPVV